MIWITTLILLALAAFFILQGLNEKRQYLADHDDPDAAAEEGLFMDAVKRVAPAKGDAPPALEEEDTLFARAARRVQTFDSPVNRLMDKKAEEAKSQTESRFDRMAKSVSQRLDTANKKAEEQRTAAVEAAPDEDLLTRMSKRVARAEETLGQRLSAESERGTASARVRADSEARLDRASAADKSPKQDWLARQAAKIGPRMEAVDERLLRRAKQATDLPPGSSSSS
jgi:hypothetical protein